MLKEGYKACMRGNFCLEGFAPGSYNPRTSRFCPACVEDMYKNDPMGVPKPDPNGGKLASF